MRVNGARHNGWENGCKQRAGNLARRKGRKKKTAQNSALEKLQGTKA